MLCFFFQSEDGIRDLVRSRGLGDVYKRQYINNGVTAVIFIPEHPFQFVFTQQPIKLFNPSCQLLLVLNIICLFDKITEYDYFFELFLFLPPIFNLFLISRPFFQYFLCIFLIIPERRLGYPYVQLANFILYGRKVKDIL